MKMRIEMEIEIEIEIAIEIEILSFFLCCRNPDLGPMKPPRTRAYLLIKKTRN